MKKCYGCGEEMSDFAPECTVCGHIIGLHTITRRWRALEIISFVVFIGGAVTMLLRYTEGREFSFFSLEAFNVLVGVAGIALGHTRAYRNEKRLAGK